MLTLEQYWNRRDINYVNDFTQQIAQSGINTVNKINKLLQMFTDETGLVRDEFSSGWRPKTVNDATSNASKLSNHITADAGDVKDPDRAFAQWCVLNPEKLAECGLWMEDPRYTPTWAHLQTVPPKSGKRIYIPSTAKPKAPALQGQSPLPYSLKV